jgi:suppressor of cytokine signaling 7
MLELNMITVLYFSQSLHFNRHFNFLTHFQNAGNFSFGSVARFRSQTMVEFIDKAIEHSRSGRFLFFLHRRPTHGPTRVQLLHPVSRFRQVQSLQHLSRYLQYDYLF